MQESVSETGVTSRTKKNTGAEGLILKTSGQTGRKLTDYLQTEVNDDR